MNDLKNNSNEDALKALEDSMKLLGELSTESGGVCLWVTPSGKTVCSPISASDCAKITGAIFLAGEKCP